MRPSITIDSGYVDLVRLRRVKEERPFIEAKIENNLGGFEKTFLVDRASYALVAWKRVVYWNIGPQDIACDKEIRLTEVKLYLLEKFFGITALKILGEQKGAKPMPAPVGPAFMITNWTDF
jgi:hypothetical protein